MFRWYYIWDLVRTLWLVFSQSFKQTWQAAMLCLLGASLPTTGSWMSIVRRGREWGCSFAAVLHTHETTASWSHVTYLCFCCSKYFCTPYFISRHPMCFSGWYATLQMSKKYEVAMQSLWTNWMLNISQIRSCAGEQESWPLTQRPVWIQMPSLCAF